MSKNCEPIRGIATAIALTAVAVFACHIPAGAQDTTPAPDERPNILLILADDWSWPHAGAYGDQAARTPTFDRLASEGILFTKAFAPAPSCTPSRLSILTGQYPHRLNEGGNHLVRFPKKYPVFTEMLEASGYAVGMAMKGANFGVLDGTGWAHDPAGKDYGNFAVFLDHIVRDRPFFFWWGSANPHRPYVLEDGMDTTARPHEVTVPAFLPDVPAVRRDMLNYNYEVSQFDRELRQALRQLEDRDMLDNTIIIVTSDNGMPFPRAKANCYDYGTRVPLAVRWPGRIEAGSVSEVFINLSDLAPTILEAAGLEAAKDMTATSFLHELTGEEPEPPTFWQRIFRFGKRPEQRDAVFLERERHGLGRGREPGDEFGYMSYPIRAIRTDDFLYVVNFRPHLWPACDPPGFIDVDPSMSKDAVLALDGNPDPAIQRYYELSFGKRPREELYDMQSDPYQINNVAEDPEYAEVKDALKRRLMRWMTDTMDPRAHGEDDRWDYYGYYDPGKITVIPERK